MKKSVNLKDGQTVALYFKNDCSVEVIHGIQQFIDSVPELKVGQSFFWGMWPVRVENREGEVALSAYDFVKQGYFPDLDKPACLWQEQSNVCLSQGISWFSLPLESHVFFTPNALQAPMLSTTEGVRDEPLSKNATGWYIYTAADRERDLPFQSASVGELLQQYNMNILRFLGLPKGWMFNIELNGASHVWNETQHSQTSH